jgi:G:T-mismatch repair DNA endonuclease (very short patch repair protein)
MSMRRNGRQLSRAVPKQDHAWITKVTDNYRQFRRILKQISELENEGRKLLKQYEEGLVKKSSKRKAYLMIKETISEAKSENASENRVENRD